MIQTDRCTAASNTCIIIISLFIFLTACHKSFVENTWFWSAVLFSLLLFVLKYIGNTQKNCIILNKNVFVIFLGLLIGLVAFGIISKLTELISSIDTSLLLFVFVLLFFSKELFCANGTNHDICSYLKVNQIKELSFLGFEFS